MKRGIILLLVGTVLLCEGMLRLVVAAMSLNWKLLIIGLVEVGLASIIWWYGSIKTDKRSKDEKQSG